MNKKKKQKAMRAAQQIVTALKSSGAIEENAKVEVRLCGHRQRRQKKEAKPRSRGR